MFKRSQFTLVNIASGRFRKTINKNVRSLLLKNTITR